MNESVIFMCFSLHKRIFKIKHIWRAGGARAITLTLPYTAVIHVVATKLLLVLISQIVLLPNENSNNDELLLQFFSNSFSE